MKRFKYVAALSALVVLGGLAEPAAARTWTNTEGRKIEAEFVAVRDGVVQLQDAAGKTYSVAIEKLSAEDRHFVAAQIGAKPAGGPAAPADAQPAAPAADANDRFSQAIRENPNSADAWYQRGLARLNRGEGKEALGDFNQAAKIDPGMAEAYDGRGQAHGALGDAAAASSDFDKAIQIKPDLATAYKHRADNLKALANTPAGKEVLDAKIEDYRKMYQAARDKQLTDKAWQPLNSTSGNITRQGLINQMAKMDYDRAKQLEASGAGKGSGGGSGSGYGGGSGKGSPSKSPPKPEYAKPQPPQKSPESPPQEPESGVVVIPEKVAKGENIVLVADEDKLAAGMTAEATAQSSGEKTPGEKSKPQKSASYGSKSNGSKAGKNPADQPAMPQEVDFYRDKDNDGKLDTEKDELLASDTDAEDGYSAEVSTKNFPIGKQKYFAVPKVAAKESANDKKSGAGGADKGAGKGGSPGEGQYPSKSSAQKGDSAKPGSEGQSEPEQVALASAAVSGDGEVVPPEEKEKRKKEGEPKSGGGAGTGGGGGPGKSMAGNKRGKRGRGYAGPRDDQAARAIERALGYVDRRDYGPAITEYDHLLTEYVDDPYYLTGRAGVHVTRGGYDLAVRDYDRVVALEPSAEIYYNRGCAHLGAGNLKEAVDDFTASLKLEELGKYSNLALNNRGTAFARQGRLDLAVADFNSAIKQNPNEPAAYRNRAIALRKLGKTADADADLAKVKQLGG